ncbi:unnamed protein product [Fraxinus pennsylvanica]|uniref:C3H1-type domain-containing protein n=1 Tax=Fraxinus pennsylvanica TaxID=56036 RepID=A0AAD1YLM3_9LAMI|nr:unnamed protein product [Fraxinus pennsylvanica]
MDSVHANDTRRVHGINNASNQLYSIQSNTVFGHFKKPRFSEAMTNSRVSLTINRSKLDIPFKSELCIAIRKGKCSYGDNCHYAHGINDIRNPTMEGLKMGEYRESYAIRTVNWADQIECKSLNAGQEYQRQNFRKTRLCNKWEKYGICYYEVNCLYAHGQEELRRPGSLVEKEHAYSSNAKIVGQSNDSGNKTAHELTLRGKRCFMKWNVEKIGCIYADWIES